MLLDKESASAGREIARGDVSGEVAAGLIYMNARFYVPSVGRFASADTIVPDPANPQSFNRYSYVENRPIIMHDPSGHNGCTFGYLDCGPDHASNTDSLNVSAYTSVTQRSDYYGWVQETLEDNGSGSKWFAAAEIVTQWNGAGAADVFLDFFTPNAAEFLRAGNEFLFQKNMETARTLLNHGNLPDFTDANGIDVSFDGLTDIELDFALVQFEQTKVHDLINAWGNAKGWEETNSIIQDVNRLFSNPLTNFASDDLVRAVMAEFFDDGATFDFSNYDDRVLLGQELIRLLHENE